MSTPKETKMSKWTKRSDRAGYDLAGTDYSVLRSYAQDADGELVAYDTEWAVARGASEAQSGENLDWYDTMREARAAAERFARRDAEKAEVSR